MMFMVVVVVIMTMMMMIVVVLRAAIEIQKYVLYQELCLILNTVNKPKLILNTHAHIHIHTVRIFNVY